MLLSLTFSLKSIDVSKIQVDAYLLGTLSCGLEISLRCVIEKKGKRKRVFLSPMCYAKPY